MILQQPFAPTGKLELHGPGCVNSSDRKSAKIKNAVLLCTAFFVSVSHSDTLWYPQPESNRQRWFRKPLLYPFNYGGISSILICSSL